MSRGPFTWLRNVTRCFSPYCSHYRHHLLLLQHQQHQLFQPGSTTPVQECCVLRVTLLLDSLAWSLKQWQGIVIVIAILIAIVIMTLAILTWSLRHCHNYHQHCNRACHCCLGRYQLPILTVVFNNSGIYSGFDKEVHPQSHNTYLDICIIRGVVTSQNGWIFQEVFFKVYKEVVGDEEPGIASPATALLPQVTPWLIVCYKVFLVDCFV